MFVLIEFIESYFFQFQNHRFNFEEPMKVEACTQSICDLALRFGEDSRKEEQMSRPFGVALLIAGYDETGPVLYVFENVVVF